MATSQGHTGTGTALDPSHQLPAVIARNQKTVHDGFWKKMARFAGKIPFAEEAGAAWFCARDPKTPIRVKATNCWSARLPIS